jgi:hypothetical protein
LSSAAFTAGAISPRATGTSISFLRKFINVFLSIQ